MRNRRVKTNSNIKGVIHPITAIILAVVGFLLFQPFFWVILIFGDSFHYVTLPIFFMIMGCIIGLPMFFMGVISFMTHKSGASTSSYNDHDVSRIRHSVEQQNQRR